MRSHDGFKEGGCELRMRSLQDVDKTKSKNVGKLRLKEHVWMRNNSDLIHLLSDIAVSGSPRSWGGIGLLYTTISGFLLHPTALFSNSTFEMTRSVTFQHGTQITLGHIH